MELDGRIAVVTGAASGIGLALSERFIREGMSVVMADIETDVLDPQVARLGADGATIVGMTCDVADPEQIVALRDLTLDRFGAAHVLCNNAGVAVGRPNHKTSPAAWRWTVDVNLLGPAYAVSAFVPGMVEQGEGHVVNTASEAGLASTPLLGSYHATKYGVVGLSESLALELDGTGVGVSCLCPELVDTRIFESTRNAPAELGLPKPGPVPMEQIEQFMGSTAMDPADVAGQVVYAIRTNQFWVITHAATQRRLTGRNARLQALENPKMER